MKNIMMNTRVNGVCGILLCWISLQFAISVHAQTTPAYDVIIKNGTIVNGTGMPRFKGDIAISGEKIAAVGSLDNATANIVVDATGQVVAPGFINMLSWAARPLMRDGRSMSDIKQGVTLEVFGEGTSLGPIPPEVAQKNNTPWQTLGQGLEYLVKQGITPNVASFVGATTIRIDVVGRNDRAPTPAELHKMQQLVRQAMKEGALGVGSSLIYAPAYFASTKELTALASAAVEYDGMYITHMRSEGDKLEEAVNEFTQIITDAGIDGEIYHLKAAGKRNWNKLPWVLHRLDSLRAAGHQVAANMYTYTAASTGLDATMPPWVQEGTTQDWINRLKKPQVRTKVIAEMESDTTDWENFLQLAGNPDNILLLEFQPDSLQKYTGMTVGAIAQQRHTSAANTIVDLVIANGGDIGSVYFYMSEDNVRRKLKTPYITFGSDAGSVAAEGKVLKSSTHPRTYGNFARLLGKYVREEKVLSLEEAIHRLSYLPAQQLKIKHRGKLAKGFKADIVIFDPDKIDDRATFTHPHQYAVGMKDVFVNGVQVLENGKHTGRFPGEVVRGPGYKK
jgi:N-acyl-D-amino-acid deacylase